MLPQYMQKIIFVCVTMASSLLENVCSGCVFICGDPEGELSGKEYILLKVMIWLGKTGVLLRT